MSEISNTNQNLSVHETQHIISIEEAKAIKELRRKLGEERDALVDDVTLVRFLRARKLDVELAYTMYTNYLSWYGKLDVDKILKDGRPLDQLLNYLVSNSYHGYDRHGRPIYIERSGVIHVDEFAEYIPLETVVDVHIWFMEFTIKRMKDKSKEIGRPITQLVNILDMKGLGMSHRKMLGIFQGVAQIDQDYYPETLGTMYMVNCPWIFPVLWKMCKPFLDKRTTDKMKILGSDLTEMVQDLGAKKLTCRVWRNV